MSRLLASLAFTSLAIIVTSDRSGYDSDLEAAPEDPPFRMPPE